MSVRLPSRSRRRGLCAAPAEVPPRLFVAVWPPPRVVEQLAALPRPDEPGVRWTAPGRWHVTLRFLGTVDVDEASRRLVRIHASPTEARFGPRVARLGRNVVVVPVAGLDALVAAVISATADLGEPPDPRPFAGHVTLARLRHRAACGVTGHEIAGSWPVTAVELVASELHPDGARYTTVARRELIG